MPKITVVVPVYNVEAYIERCLDSIVSQTMSDFEIVVVNDGSPDHSEEIVLNYQKKEKRIRYFYQENMGLGAARNKGILEAKGEFICFIDSDDYIEPDYLACLYQVITHEKADIAYCGMRQVDDQKNILGVNPQTEEELWSFEQPSACNKLYRLSLFKDYQITFPVKLYYEDLATIPKLLMVSKKNVRVDKYLYNYYFNEGSITKSYGKRVVEMKKVLQILEDFVKANHLEAYHENMEYVYLYAGVINTSFRMIMARCFSKKEIVEMIRHFESVYPHCYQNQMAKKRFPLKYKVIAFLIRHRMITVYRWMVLLRGKVQHG